MFAAKWFLTVFSCVLPVDSVLRVWDCFLIDGWPFIYAVGISLLEFCESTPFSIHSHTHTLSLTWITCFFREIIGSTIWGDISYSKLCIEWGQGRGGFEQHSRHRPRRGGKTGSCAAGNYQKQRHPLQHNTSHQEEESRERLAVVLYFYIKICNGYNNPIIVWHVYVVQQGSKREGQGVHQ